MNISAIGQLKLACLAMVLAGIGSVGMLTASTTSSEAAVVYCKRVGYPKGCVVRATPRIVYCQRVGYPKGCVVR